MQSIHVAAPASTNGRAGTAIQIRGLFKHFAARGSVISALEGVDLAIQQGEFVCVVGPSGCGKTTLLNILGLEPASGGGVEFAPHTPGKPYPHQLSGGMRQRVNIARAFANDPEILLMDEPFAALDEQTKLILQDRLLQIWEGSRKTVLFITHSLDEAIRLADRVVVMTARPGRIKTIIQVELARRDMSSLCRAAQSSRGCAGWPGRRSHGGALAGPQLLIEP